MHIPFLLHNVDELGVVIDVELMQGGVGLLLLVICGLVELKDRERGDANMDIVGGLQTIETCCGSDAIPCSDSNGIG